MSLAQGANGRIERYSTDALSWLLAHDVIARRAFLDLCASKLHDGSSTSRVVAALRAADSVLVETEIPIAVVQRNRDTKQRRLDLRLIADRNCLVVEVKVEAPASWHRDDDEDDEDVNGGTGATARWVPQTKTYRRWLDDHYAERGALFVLTRVPAPDLAADCHGSLLWQELYAAFHAVIAEAGSLVSQYCSFMEGRGMARRTHPRITAATQRIANDTAIWEQLSAIANECAMELHAALSQAGFKPQLKGLPYLGMAPDPDGILLWSQWVRVPHTSVRTATWFTPYLYVARISPGIVAKVGVSYTGMSRENLAELVEVEFEPLDGEFACILPLPAGFDLLETVSSQASALVDMAMSSVVGRVLGRTDRD